MIRDITLGQYYSGDSVIHRLDPRTKLLWTFLFLISLFIEDNLWYMLGLAVLVMIYIMLSKVPVGYMVKGLKPVWFLVAFSVIMNLFSGGGEALFTFWKIKITNEGMHHAILIGMRMIMMVLGSSVMTYTTKPTDLADGLESSLKWLSIFKVPVHDLAMMMSIALRFIPVLTEELNRIMKAQAARGMDFSKAKWKDKLKAILPILIPMFVSAVKRAEELAFAMEARCYQGGKGRTRMYPLKRRFSDYCFIVGAWGILIVGILI